VDPEEPHRGPQGGARAAIEKPCFILWLKLLCCKI